MTEAHLAPGPSAGGTPPEARPGQVAEITTTVTEQDVTAFAALSGDRHPLHTDEAYAATTRFGARIAHGALLLAYVSAASTRYVETALPGRTTVWYGFDRVRFIRPVYFGDTIRTEYRIESVDSETGRVVAQATCTNQRGETVAVATHLLKLL